MADPIADGEPIASGLATLDTILGGGYAANRAHPIEGRPGAGKTTLTTLIYASKSRLAPETAQSEVAKLVAWSRGANAKAGITGALLFDGAHFVQVLEANDAMIDQLLLKLQADPRHEGLVIVKHAPLAERQFSGWALGYSGSSKFVTKNILPLFDEANQAGQRRAAQRLIDFMRDFAES